MTATGSKTSSPVDFSQIRQLEITGGVLLIAQNAVFFTAFAILGAAIGWPASLDLPAIESLPLIGENASAVFNGYYLYLLSVIITLPMWVVVRNALGERLDTLGRTLFDLAIYLCIAAVVFKGLGILRWLFAMPHLSDLLDAGDVSPAIISMMFDTLNFYAGKSGEHLGVQLMSALYTLCVGAALARLSGFLRWVGFFAMLVGLLFLPYADLLDLDNGPFLMISGYSNTALTIALAVFFLRGQRQM